MTTSQQSTDLKKVTHATLHYRNQLGITVSKKPRKPSVNGQVIAKDALLQHGARHHLRGEAGAGDLEGIQRADLQKTWKPNLKNSR